MTIEEEGGEPWWRMSNRVSVEGSYDNVNDISSSALGNLGADIRWRLEFE